MSAPSSTYLRSGSSQLPDYPDCPDHVKLFLHDLVHVRNRSVSTANAYYVDIRSFLRFLKIRGRGVDLPFSKIAVGDVTLDELRSVTDKDILDFLGSVLIGDALLSEDDLKDIPPDSPKTINRKRTSLFAFFEFLVERFRFGENPVAGVRGRKTGTHRSEPMSVDQADRLLEAAKVRRYPERDHCITSLFLHCGLRLSELVSLDLDQIVANPEHNAVSIRVPGKEGKERTVLLDAAARSSLSDWLSVRDTIGNLIDRGALFVSPRTRKRLTSRAVQKIVSQEIAYCRLDPRAFSTDVLRSAAGTLSGLGSADPDTLRKFTGHENTAAAEIASLLPAPPCEQIGSFFEKETVL